MTPATIWSVRDDQGRPTAIRSATHYRVLREIEAADQIVLNEIRHD
jgi:hypothetical protein